MALLRWKRAVRDSNPAASADAGPVAFEDLALPLLPALYNIARWLSQNTVDAEDLVQETFLKALRGFDSFEQGSNFKAWIFRILRNTYLTSRSGLAALRTVPLEEELQQGSESGFETYPEAAIDRLTPEINLMRLADRAALQSAMEKLPPLLLEVILLCDVEEMKYKEIASVLDVPIGTVMSRIARARAHLRQLLTPDATLNRESRA
ncbi:MAG: sigma-70 family RNA polymerase sigma factor [Candidatus Sulfotelmatobacter sp.]